MGASGALHVDTAGAVADPAVVLVHGFLGAGDDWGDIVADLGRDHFCITVDLPGHGRSVPPPAASCTFAGAVAALRATLAECALDRPVLAGYSMGGRLALQLALDLPEAWSGLVLESASPGIADPAERQQRRLADEDWARRFEREPTSAVLDDWYAQAVFTARASDPVVLAGMLARRQRNDPVELARVMRGLGVGQQPSLWDALGRLRPPLLLLAGEYDLKYVEVSERMQQLCPGSARVVVPASGHNVHVDNPGAWLRAVRGRLMAWQG